MKMNNDIMFHNEEGIVGALAMGDNDIGYLGKPQESARLFLKGCYIDNHINTTYTITSGEAFIKMKFDRDGSMDYTINCDNSVLPFVKAVQSEYKKLEK